MKKILVINGPNLNMLGTRKPEIYGSMSLLDIEEKMMEKGKNTGVELEFFQSNHEGDIVDEVQNAKGNFDGIIINAGAYSHYSYAIADAIEAIMLPCVEVHISNIFAREGFRSNSVLSSVCTGIVSGFSYKSYLMAMEYFI